MSIGNDEYIQWLQWVFESFKLSFQITVYLLQDGQISEGSFENSNYRGNHSHSPTKILKQQAIAKHRMTSKLEHLHGFASRKLGPLGVFFWYSYIVIRFYQRGPRKPGPTPFEHLKMLLCKAQFLSHTTQSKQMRFGRNQQFWDDSCVCIFQTRLTCPLCASDLEVIIFSMFFSLQTVQRGYFWLSPACRGNASQCIPYFSPFTDWLDPIITHKAIVWNIPLAVAGANVSLTCNEFGGVFFCFLGFFVQFVL